MHFIFNCSLEKKFFLALFYLSEHAANISISSLGSNSILVPWNRVNTPLKDVVLSPLVDATCKTSLGGSTIIHTITNAAITETTAKQRFINLVFVIATFFVNDGLLNIALTLHAFPNKTDIISANGSDVNQTRALHT